MTGRGFTPEEARAAGLLGGAAVSRDREHMARIGRRGGRASAEARLRQRLARNLGIVPPSSVTIVEARS